MIVRIYENGICPALIFICQGMWNVMFLAGLGYRT